MADLIPRNAADYLDQLVQMMPPGDIWRRELDSFQVRTLDGFAPEFARIDNRLLDLFEEMDPRTTSELFEGWERVLNLPDPCLSAAQVAEQTLEQRRDWILWRLTHVAGSSPQHLVDIAKQFGFDIDIQEYPEPRYGLFECGDDLWDVDTGHTWTVISEGLQDQPLEFMFEAGSALTTWNDGALACVMPEQAHLYRDLQGVDSSGDAEFEALTAEQTVANDADWTGAKTGCSVDGDGNLVADAVGEAAETEAFYAFGETVDFQEVYTLAVVPAIDAYGRRLGDAMSDWGSLADLPTLLNVGPGIVTVEVQCRLHQGDPVADPGGWSAWQTIPPGEAVTARALDPRLRLASAEADVQVMVASAALAFRLDADAARIAGWHDLFIPAGGREITFRAGFLAPPAVRAFGGNLLPDDTVSITSITATGCIVAIEDAAGQPADRSCNGLAKGFGYEAEPYPEAA